MSDIKNTLMPFTTPAPLPSAIQQLSGIYKWIGGMMQIWTFPMELLFRTQLGVRYVSTIQFYVSLIGMLFLTGVSMIVDFSIDQMAAVTITYVVLFYHRRFEAWNTLKYGDPLHTYSFGRSVLDLLEPVIPRLLGFILDEWTQYKYIEPLCICILGIIVWNINESRVVAVWLMTGAGFMMLKAQLLYSAQIEALLNQYDATLTQHVMPKLLSGQATTPQEKAGIAVSPAMQAIWASLPTVQDGVPDIENTVRRAMSGTPTEGASDVE